VDTNNIFTTTPREHQLITKLYGPDPKEKAEASRAVGDEAEYDLSFVCDIEDAGLLGGRIDDLEEETRLK
jgi:hypothetical protein